MSNQTEIRTAQLEKLGEERTTAELRGDVSFLGEVLTDELVGVVPDVDRISPLEIIDREVIPTVAEL